MEILRAQSATAGWWQTDTDGQKSRIVYSDTAVQGKPNNGAYYREARNIRVVAPGDDFAVLREEVQLDWIRKVMRETLAIKVNARLARREAAAVRY